jgi:hypothetical protein
MNSSGKKVHGKFTGRSVVSVLCRPAGSFDVVAIPNSVGAVFAPNDIVPIPSQIGVLCSARASWTNRFLA